MNRETKRRIAPLLLAFTILFPWMNNEEAVAEPYIGEIRMVGFDFAPVNWALCDGQILSISQYQSLFSLLGCQYGGDCVTTFALPDLRGRFPMHAGSGNGLSPRIVGHSGGYERVTLNVTQMPPHNHTASGTVQPQAYGSEGNSASPVGNYPAKSGDGRPDFSSTANGQMAENTVNVSVGNAGGGNSHENMPPFQVVNFIISLQGIYPPRN